MTSTAPCLSVALQLPATTAPLTLDPDSLAALQQALLAFGEFQQPYSAPADAYDPDAGMIDAAAEVSAGCVHEGPAIIILDDDAEQMPHRYLVLEAPWHELPTGALLRVAGTKASAIPAREPSPGLARAESMLTFLDYLPNIPAPGAEMPPAEVDFDSFMQDFAASSKGEPVSEAALAAWQGRLPDLLLALWRRDGLARYRDDQLTMVDPRLYAGVVAAYLGGKPLAGVDTFHAYAVTPFGQILVLGENTAVQIHIDPHSGEVVADEDAPDASDASERYWRLQTVLELLDGHYLDVTDDDEQPLLAHAVERLGPLEANEMYSFFPTVSEGGWNAANLVKRDRLAELKALAAAAAGKQPSLPDARGR